LDLFDRSAKQWSLLIGYFERSNASSSVVEVMLPIVIVLSCSVHTSYRYFGPD